MQRKGLDPTWLVTWCESQVRELETAPNTLQPVHRHPTLAGWDTCWSWWEIFCMVGCLRIVSYREMVKQLLGFKTLPTTFPFAGDNLLPCLVFATNTASVPAIVPCQLRVLLLHP